MAIIKIFSLVWVTIFLISGCADAPSKKEHKESKQNFLTDTEKQEGWILLFDGKTFNGWHGLGQEKFPSTHWVIENGAIKRVAKEDVPDGPDGKPVPGGDLISDQSWEDYEFAFEWKVAKGSNSGVKYNVSEEFSVSRGSGRGALGWEYQVIDDENYKGELKPYHRAGGLYDMIEATNKTLKPVGEWNSSKIVFIGNHGEHWLNGVKVVEYDMDTPEFDALYAKSKYFKIPTFKDKKKGHIVLQDHGDAAWYRNLKIRPVSK
jgi:hypothetical protein